MAEFRLEDFDKVLIVEGYSDLLFYAAVFRYLDKENVAFIKEFGGKGNITKNLELFVTPQLVADKNRIGVIVDANGNAPGTFAQVRDVLQQLTGKAIANSGDWSGGEPEVGLLVVPNGETAGEIETLVWNAWCSEVANKDKRDCIVSFVECMQEGGLVAKSASKGLIGSLLAIAHDEDPRLGPGARANVFDLSHPTFVELREFLDAY